MYVFRIFMIILFGILTGVLVYLRNSDPFSDRGMILGYLIFLIGAGILVCIIATLIQWMFHL